MKSECSVGWHVLHCGQPNRHTDRLASSLIGQLISNQVYDSRYEHFQDGMLGTYTSHLNALEDEPTERPISVLVIPHVNDQPFGAAIARSGSVVPGLTHDAHVYINPDRRRQGYGKRACMALVRALPDAQLGMVETDDSKNLLRELSGIRAVRKQTPLERDCAAALRALTESFVWTDQNGSVLGHEAIARTLSEQHALIRELQQRLDPDDDAILPPLPSC